jgi:hypothetical protein
MESYSIPSSNRVIGRFSTPWLSRSRALNRRTTRSSVFGVRPRTSGANESSVVGWTRYREPATRISINAQRSTLNAQRSTAPVGRWTLNASPARTVGRWALSSGRVKGAWWPSRSSKPSSTGNGRDRFDSYPLRDVVVSDIGFPADEMAVRHRQDGDVTSSKGGERDAPRASAQAHVVIF